MKNQPIFPIICSNQKHSWGCHQYYSSWQYQQTMWPAEKAKAGKRKKRWELKPAATVRQHSKEPVMDLETQMPKFCFFSPEQKLCQNKRLQERNQTARAHGDSVLWIPNSTQGHDLSHQTAQVVMMNQVIEKGYCQKTNLNFLIPNLTFIDHPISRLWLTMVSKILYSCPLTWQSQQSYKSGMYSLLAMIFW